MEEINTRFIYIIIITILINCHGSGPDPDKTDSNPSTPPPVEYNPKNNIVSNNNMTSSSSNENGGSHSQPTTPLSPIIPNFPPTIDSSRREASTGDSVRDRCRDMVYNAMKKGIVDGIDN